MSEDFRSITNDEQHSTKSKKPKQLSMPSEAIKGGENEVIEKWPAYSIFVKCLACSQKGHSRIERTLSPLGIALVLIFCPTIIVPIAVLCLDNYYISKHYCEHCGKYYGSSGSS